jgi:glycosyltransferase involved in cell wall biosynthesis
MNHLGIVIIGRNEGERLRRCLESVVGRGSTVVYVDSDSTDGSVELARTMGVEVVELDASSPLTAARARNAGFARLEEIDPETQFVQFVDGDCELVTGWLEEACQVLIKEDRIAAVSGRRRERFPEQSIYNRLTDIEWDSPTGEVRYCGGDVLIRITALRQVGGYNPALIAGEDPDLSVRLRQHGWTIRRLAAEMTLHDMAMTQFSQWWKRCVRSGFVFAEGVAMHGAAPERHFVHDVRSTVFWGLALPLATLALALPTHFGSLGLILAYPLQMLRIAWRHRRSGAPWHHAWLYGGACVLGRFPNAIGAVRYWASQLHGRSQTLIEYR